MAQTDATRQPRRIPCLQCGRKPARLLAPGERKVFCSLRCAARRGLDAATDLVWCPRHGLWFNAWDEMRRHESCLKEAGSGEDGPQT
jgi:hypothetical protein